MLTIAGLAQPDTIEEAYRVLTARKNNAVLGGCAFLRMGTQKIGTAVDLGKLNLNFIEEDHDFISIGAAATFREVETYPGLQRFAAGLLPKAVGHVLGVQFRNLVTVGASVYAKYGFSDLITALLVLETEVELYKGGRMPLAVFLDRPAAKDILIRLSIKKSNCRAAYQSLRCSASDYPVLNAAVSNTGRHWLVAVGARPRRAAIAKRLSEALSQQAVTCGDLAAVTELAAEELAFGTNARGSAGYRRAMSKVLIRRAIEEVLQCR